MVDDLAPLPDATDRRAVVGERGTQPEMFLLRRRGRSSVGRRTVRQRVRELAEGHANRLRPDGRSKVECEVVVLFEYESHLETCGLTLTMLAIEGSVAARTTGRAGLVTGRMPLRTARQRDERAPDGPAGLARTSRCGVIKVAMDSA
jgi:hypothetical protein